MYGFGGLGQVEVEEEKMSPWQDNDEQKGKIGLLSQWTMDGWDEQKIISSPQHELYIRAFHILNDFPELLNLDDVSKYSSILK